MLGVLVAENFSISDEELFPHVGFSEAEPETGIQAVPRA